MYVSSMCVLRQKSYFLQYLYIRDLLMVQQMLEIYILSLEGSCPQILGIAFRASEQAHLSTRQIERRLVRTYSVGLLACKPLLKTAQLMNLRVFLPAFIKCFLYWLDVCHRSRKTKTYIKGRIIGQQRLGTVIRYE